MSAAAGGADVLLVGCVSRKHDEPRSAKDLYRSPLFRFRRAYAEASGRPWLILSALHGAVGPDDVLAPYDLRLSSLPAPERARWGERVVDELRRRLGDLGGVRFEAHAGAAYADAVAAPLARAGAELLRPLEGLPIGRQLQWYRARSTPAVDARAHLESLVGETIPTLSGRPNRILALRGDDVVVATERSPAGQRVPIRWVQEAIDQLVERGELAIEVATVGYRSAFVGAVLATLPGAVVAEGTRRIRLER